ncbi:MAG: YeeE/YedE family protein [Eubacteriales bacterium]|nr:YeeE/YedE family protein [Eubacteriales bacterium]MDD3198062.1 YeeE/YedE family protein [Eubacteriales bacterium]MDD3504385.1 YeeE/YedE family protein [Eubacteriales bacterium]MDD4682606.1 YeeE/YedE family protein [Eubacteriales bacterium]
MKRIENVIGFVGIILMLVLGKTLLSSDILFFRLVIGAGLGYTLMRAYTGFAGSINRAYLTGSTKLLRAMMLMFFLTALLTAGLLFKGDITTYNLWINPINFGLLAGGLLFGFGMSFSSCCASGVLTDLVTGLPRAFFTLLFFGIGVFVGFPLQKTAIATDRWVTSTTGESLNKGGVFLPDLFAWDGLGGYLGAIILTGVFCALFVFIGYAYEKKRKAVNTYSGHFMEKIQDKPDEFDSKNFRLLSAETYDRFFAKSWTLKQGAVVLSVLFLVMIAVTKAGWGASTPYGLWFGKILMVFGVSADSLAEFTKMPVEGFTTPFFKHAVSVQNFGIVIGTMLYLLTAGKFRETFMSEIKVKFSQILLFSLGGFTMGFGTRLSNGCNVGALYTPIANFSLSGWIFFVFLAAGAVLGNILGKKLAKE